MSTKRLVFSGLNTLTIQGNKVQNKYSENQLVIDTQYIQRFHA